ncbi:MAG: AAA family ATPase [Candidatus Sericytochromatia bacterium]
MDTDRIRYFQKVSQSPTNPHALPRQRVFDVAELYEGPVAREREAGPSTLALDEKLRQAYFWIVNHAIISPYYDIEYLDGPAQSFEIGTSRLTLPSDQSYSSFVLLPLLNFAIRRKCLLIGGPGRGKTASAVLMGVLAGYPVREVRRAIQHGQPQMTISDLLGNPMPADLIEARSMDQIKISWRKWLGMRVKIIDEYNRIPTRTQSALLTVMGDNYAEIFDQIYECPEAAWYLTANADSAGGTYQVIEALRDRIDIVVKTLHFSSRFLGELMVRIENEIKPEEVVPAEIIFTETEMDQMYHEVLRIELPEPIRRRIEHFASHFEFCDPAGAQLEYKTKDTLRLSAREIVSLPGEADPLDLGQQTLNGLSVRALLTLVLFCKALAYFRGNAAVILEDVRQILPFVLHDKLIQNPEAAFFSSPENEVYRIDRISWLRRLFDASCQEYDRLDLDNHDPLRDLANEFERGLQGVTAEQVTLRLQRIETLLDSLLGEGPLTGPVYEDVLRLKYLHQRYTNYLKWLQWRS